MRVLRLRLLRFSMKETFPRDQPTSTQETHCVRTRSHGNARIEEQDRRVCMRTLCPERDSDSGLTGVGYAAEPTDAGLLLARRDDFRATVLSGLLLHICPPSGQFADLFGLEDSLRERILAMLGVKDLVAFGLVSLGLERWRSFLHETIRKENKDLRTSLSP